VSPDNPSIDATATSLKRCCRAAIAKPESKFLNPRTDSFILVAVTNLAALAKNFHKIFTFQRTKADFQTACCRYVDK
jgi:hypothetical protein